MEALNLLLSICCDESRATARANTFSKNGYSVITVQNLDDGASFSSMLDLQAVIIDQTFWEAGAPALAGFKGVPVLQLHQLMRADDLVAWVRAHERIPVGLRLAFRGQHAC